jgi:hypothetical protein
MSIFLHHEPCPECRRRGQDRKGDNLGVWDDHKWCFKCTYREGGEGLSLEQIKHQFQGVELEEKQRNALDFPLDYSRNIRLDALAWIKKFGITEKELDKHFVGWSNSRQMLIYPIFDKEGGLVMWQGRNFGNGLKYFTNGDKSHYHLLNAYAPDSPLVVVEDMVSAIKISRQFAVLPLFGAFPSRRLMFHMSQRFVELVIWLDPNMKKEMLNYQKRAESYFAKVRVVFSELDPKYYNDGEINGYVRPVPRPKSN